MSAVVEKQKRKKHDEDDYTVQEKKTCGCGKHENCCCRKLTFILDEAQNVNNKIKIEVQRTFVCITYLKASYDLNTFYDTNTLAFHATDIARGPDGGIVSITPLRL
jgi:hypothetical protein